jgi:hypothetical protein
MGLAKERGEAEFRLPLLDRTPENGGSRLTWTFAAAAVRLARSHDDPEEALRDEPVEWRDNELIFGANYLIDSRSGLTEAEAKEKFAIVMTDVIASDEAAVLRTALREHVETTQRLEDELDGLAVAHTVPGTCDWCPDA